MPTDVIYGSDYTARLGIMADATTDPTAWQGLEFVSMQLNPTRERIARPKLGQARNNALDPIKPIPGFFKFGMTLTLDADSLMLPLVLRQLLGAPSSSGPSTGIYTHLWTSGDRSPHYVALQLKASTDADATPVRVFRGLVLSSVSVQIGGEQTQNFDVVLTLRGLARARVSDWLSGTNAAIPAESPISRATFEMDGAAASNTLDGAWSWDLQTAEDAFLSTSPQLSGLRPGGGALQGSAHFRALAAAIDAMEEADTVFAAKHRMYGVTTGHELLFEHPGAQFAAPPLSIAGPGLIERTVTWSAFQTSAAPGAKLTVKNGVSAYA